MQKKYGPWAVVTGASSGIGLELATQLAASGIHLVMVARQEQKLKAAGKKLETEYGIKVISVAADVAEPDGLTKIDESTKNLPVGLLVVSAGYGTSGLFVESDIDEETNLLKVNCEALLWLTHHYSLRFVEQKRGGIILMSSMVAFQGVPYSANYAASKAYV